MKRKRTGGRWDPSASGLYFLAATAPDIEPCSEATRTMLVALNHMAGVGLDFLERWCGDAQNHLFIDSGAYNLAAEVADAEGVQLSEVFGRRAEKIPGFPALLTKYLATVERLMDKAWGYVELDFGGPEGKREIRAMLESKGLAPVPVYHPFADPPEYFDEIAGQYDRIAVGGLVGLPRSIKIRIAATIHHRARAYPNTWVHSLGIAPSDVTTAFPTQSCDASSWVGLARWPGALAARACNTRFSSAVPQLHLPDGFRLGG